MVAGKVLYTVEEVLEINGGILPLSKSAVYKLIRNKEIPSKRIGKRVFILGSFFNDLRKTIEPQGENQQASVC